MVVDQDDRRGRFVEGFFQNAADIHGGLGRRSFGDVLLAKALVLSVQEHGDDDLLTLAGEARAEVVGDSLRGFEGGGCEFPGAHPFAEFKCGLDLRDFRRPKAGHFQQVLDAGAIEPAKTVKVLQKGTGKVGGVLSRHTLLERPLSDAEDDGEQLRIGQLFGPFGKQPFSRAAPFWASS